MKTKTTPREGSRGRWQRTLAGLLTAAVLLPLPALAVAQTLQDQQNAERRQLTDFIRQQRVQFRSIPISERRNGAVAEFAEYERDLRTFLNALQRVGRQEGRDFPPPPYSPFTFTGRYTRF